MRIKFICSVTAVLLGGCLFAPEKKDRIITVDACLGWADTTYTDSLDRFVAEKRCVVTP